MDIRYLTLKRIKILQEGIAFLDNYKPPRLENKDGDTHIVGKSVSYEDRDIEMTDLLTELGKINERRAEIIQKFKDKVV